MRQGKSQKSGKNWFSLYIHLMAGVGIWPIADNTLFLKFRISVAILLLISETIASLIKLSIICGSPEALVDTIIMLDISVLICAKAILLYTHRDQLARVVHSALEDWELIDNPSYRKMMSKQANFSNTITKTFYSMGALVLVIYILKCLVFDEVDELEVMTFNGTSAKLGRRYILPYGCIFDNYGNSLYYPTVAVQAIQLFVNCSINLVGDTFYVAITLHLCQQCEIMKLEFKRFGEFDRPDKNHNHLRRLIARHQDLMRRAEMLEDVYNEIIFVQMFTSILSISFTGFNFLLSLNEGNVIGAAKNISIMQFMMAQCYFYTFPADELKDQADGLLAALYGSQWTHMPPYIKRDMVFMMMRINLPPYYTAGKFFYVTRQSYMVIIKTAMSYLSVLRLMIK